MASPRRCPPFAPSAFFGAWILFFVFPRTSLADERRFHLEVAPSAEASAGCPDAPALEAAVTSALGHDTARRPLASDGTPRFEVAFTRDRSGYVATIRENRENRGNAMERTIASGEAACSNLTDAIALAITVRLDSLDDAPPAKASSLAAPPDAPESIAKRPNTPPPSGDARYRDPEARTAHHSVFAELLGNGLIYSVNYEHILEDNVSVRVGFSYTRSTQRPLFTLFGDGPSHEITELTFPLLANVYLGTASHKLQLGLGTTLFYRSGPADGSSVEGFFMSTAEGFHFAGTLVIGYRYIPRSGGVTFTGGFTPLFAERGFLPWPSIGVGGVF